MNDIRDTPTFATADGSKSDPPRTGAANNRHRSKQDYETPPEFIAACEARFGPIVFDLAASFHNKKAECFFQESENSLIQPWHEIDLLPNGTCWLNPPFGVIGPWASKCRLEAALGCRILMLTPASVDSNWWAENVHGVADVYFVSPRIQFLGADDPYPKSLALSCFGFARAGYSPWRWK
jgi:phage N-6-adenine-methyltransferase